MKSVPMMTRETLEVELRRQLAVVNEQLARVKDLRTNKPGDDDDQSENETLIQMEFANFCRHLMLCATISNLDAVWEYWGPNS